MHTSASTHDPMKSSCTRHIQYLERGHEACLVRTRRGETERDGSECMATVSPAAVEKQGSEQREDRRFKSSHPALPLFGLEP